MIRCIFTDFLQPAFVNILQQRVFAAVGVFRTLHAVKADHDAVQCLTFHDGVTDTHLEILKLRPQVQLRVGQHRVKVGLLAFIFHIDHQRRIDRFTLFRGGVSGSGNGAANTQPQQLTGLLSHWGDINQRQESGGLLDLVFQRLLHRRLHSELAGQFFNCHTVQTRQLLQVSVKSKAGILLHQVLCSISNWSECQRGRYRLLHAGGSPGGCLHDSAYSPVR